MSYRGMSYYSPHPPKQAGGGGGGGADAGPVMGPLSARSIFASHPEEYIYILRIYSLYSYTYARFLRITPPRSEKGDPTIHETLYISSSMRVQCMLACVVYHVTSGKKKSFN